MWWLTLNRKPVIPGPQKSGIQLETNVAKAGNIQLSRNVPKRGELTNRGIFMPRPSLGFGPNSPPLGRHGPQLFDSTAQISTASSALDPSHLPHPASSESISGARFIS